MCPCVTEWSTIQLNMANVHFWLHARWVIIKIIIIHSFLYRHKVVTSEAVDVAMLTVAAVGIRYFRNRKYIQFAKPAPVVGEYGLVVLVRLQHKVVAVVSEELMNLQVLSIRLIVTL